MRLLRAMDLACCEQEAASTAFASNLAFNSLFPQTYTKNTAACRYVSFICNSVEILFHIQVNSSQLHFMLWLLLNDQLFLQVRQSASYL